MCSVLAIWAEWIFTWRSSSALPVPKFLTKIKTEFPTNAMLVPIRGDFLPLTDAPTATAMAYRIRKMNVLTFRAWQNSKDVLTETVMEWKIALTNVLMLRA